MASSLEGNLCIITGATSTGIDEMCLSFMRRCHLFGALTCAGVATTAFSTKLCLTQCGRYVTAEPAEASTVCRPSASVCRCLLSVVCCMLSIVCYPLQAWDCQTSKVMPIHGGWPAVHSKLLGPSYVKDKCLGTFVPVSLLRVLTCNVRHPHQITE